MLRSVTLIVGNKTPSNIHPFIVSSNLTSTDTIRRMAANSSADYVLIVTKPTPVSFGDGAIERLVHAASDSDAAMVYADHYEKRHEADGEQVTRHPAIDYQIGSIRDDFDFGSVLLIRGDHLREWAEKAEATHYQYAGLYDLRLYLSRHANCSI